MGRAACDSGALVCLGGQSADSAEPSLWAGRGLAQTLATAATACCSTFESTRAGPPRAEGGLLVWVHPFG